MNPLYAQRQKQRGALEIQPIKRDANFELDNSINLLAPELPSYFRSLLERVADANSGNAELLCKFLFFESDIGNIKPSTKQTHIKVICWIDRYLGHKDFSEIKR